MKWLIQQMLNDHEETIPLGFEIFRSIRRRTYQQFFSFGNCPFRPMLGRIGAGRFKNHMMILKKKEDNTELEQQQQQQQLILAVCWSDMHILNVAKR